MKTRIPFLLLLSFALTTLHAQSVISCGDLGDHELGNYSAGVENVFKQRNGDILTYMHSLLIYDDAHLMPDYIGNVMFRVKPPIAPATEPTLMDSVFVFDSLAPYYFMGRNPYGEGNIRAGIEYDEDSDSSFMRFSFFTDDAFLIYPDDDIVVPLCEGRTAEYYYDKIFMEDSKNDMIVRYYKARQNGGFDTHIARFGLDGTLKQEALLTDNQQFAIMDELCGTPQQFFLWRDYNNDNLIVYVIDSSFNQRYSSIIDQVIYEEPILVEGTGIYKYAREHFRFSNDTDVIPIGGNDVLLAAQYMQDTNWHPITAEYGIAVARYDVRTGQRKALQVFNDYPGYFESRCMGLKSMADGTVYLFYKESGYNAGYGPNVIVVVKMDADLNVEWKRFYKLDNISMEGPQTIIPYNDANGEEKGVAWVGTGNPIGTERQVVLFFFLNHDGTVGTNESGMEVRPYSLYPNPTQGELRMQYSPDAEPSQIELHDMQGRLVHTQHGSLQSLNISQLPAGVYTMRVTMKDGNTFVDKVVKE